MLLVLLLISGCLDKEEDITGPVCLTGCTTIQGKLTTGTGSAPLGSAILTLEWVNTRYLSGGTIRKKATAKTDADGNYQLAFQVRDDELGEGYFNVDIAVDTVQYMLCGKDNYSFTFFEMKRDTTIEVNSFIPRKAFLELRLSNPEQVKTSDYFASTVYSPVGVDGEQSCGKVETWRSDYSSTRVVEVAAEQPVVIDTRKTKDGVQTVTMDTLLLSVGQRVVRTVEF
ncbi:hypothetical protein [Pontibacter litorisediminis]|uniref:hypothetical protein n=1 Tax=Pontibacter litorisediminis TaxID=1846260 RepID=UPI0023EDA6AD|nr:hypothetical protein [Pontibacter litorisediminis]